MAQAGSGKQQPPPAASSSSIASIGIIPTGGGGGGGGGVGPTRASSSSPQTPLDGGAFLLQLLQRSHQPHLPDGYGDDAVRRHRLVDPAVAAIGPSHPFSPPPPNLPDSRRPSQSPPWLLPPGFQQRQPGPDNQNPSFLGNRPVFQGDLGFPRAVFDGGDPWKNPGRIGVLPPENMPSFGSFSSSHRPAAFLENNFSTSTSQVHKNVASGHQGPRVFFSGSTPEPVGRSVISRSPGETGRSSSESSNFQDRHFHHERLGRALMEEPRSGVVEQRRLPGPAHGANGLGERVVAVNGRPDEMGHGRPSGSSHRTETLQEVEEDLLAEETVDSLILADKSAEKNADKSAGNGSRGKDFRSDFSRGHQVSSQRMRIRRREMKCRWDIERQSPSFLSIYKSLIPAEEEKAKQKQLLLSLEKLVNKEWPNAHLYLYGSCANSFGVSKSDIDICLAIDIDHDMTKSDILLRLAEILQADNLQNVQALTRARVPIVKLMDPATGISCDICINNILAVVNTKLLRDYAQIDERLRQLAFIVKHWAKSRGVNETYQGTLSSYAYVLMCIHFLQMRKPAVLPCLQGMEVTYAQTVDDVECAYFDQVEKLRYFGSQNKESIAELLWSFFNYWAYCHDYTNDVISIRTGTIISKRAKDWTRRIGNDRHLICIEDPFETSHDLGRVVDKYTIKILREEFERAADIMQYDPHPGVKLFEPYVRDSPEN